MPKNSNENVKLPNKIIQKTAETSLEILN